MKKLLLGVVVVMIVLASASVAFVIISRMNSGGAGATGDTRGYEWAKDPLTPSDRVGDLSIPAFELVDQDGRSATPLDFQGRVTIVDFFFTRCTLVCPGMNARLGALGESLRGTGVKLLSVSVDPEHDRDEALREHAALWRDSAEDWRFLTGDREEVWGIVREGLRFSIGEDPDTPITLAGGGTMNNIRHPAHFILVGPTGQVLDIYRFDDEAAVAELEARARACAARLAKGPRGG